MDKVAEEQHSAANLTYIFSGPATVHDVIYSTLHSLGGTGLPEFKDKAVFTPSDDNSDAFLALMGTMAGYVVANLLGTRRAQLGNLNVEAIVVYLQEDQNYLPQEMPRSRLQMNIVYARVSVDFKPGHGTPESTPASNVTAHAPSRKSLQLYTGIQESPGINNKVHALRPTPTQYRGLQRHFQLWYLSLGMPDFRAITRLHSGIATTNRPQFEVTETWDSISPISRRTGICGVCGGCDLDVAAAELSLIPGSWFQ